MTEVHKTESSRVFLDRKEWESFTADLRKLVLLQGAQLKGGKTQNAYTPTIPLPHVQKRSFGSTVRRFLGLKQKSVVESFDSNYGFLCSYCGADRESGDKFCRICGKLSIL